MDVHTGEQRSRNMAAIRSKDTQPEMIVRKIVHCMGYRFRLHRRDLPGTPDLVFPKYRKIINVHGCFWHMHSCRWGRIEPKSNTSFWRAKRTGNFERDRVTKRKLLRSGWKVLTIWECQARDHNAIEKRIAAFLSI